MLRCPTPARCAARTLVRRDHLEVPGKQMTARPQGEPNERFGQKSRRDFFFDQCAIAALPSVDLNKPVYIFTKTSSVEHPFKHEREYDDLGVDADRSSRERIDGWAIRSAHQGEKTAMQTHKDKKIRAVIVFNSGDDVVRAGMADIISTF